MFSLVPSSLVKFPHTGARRCEFYFILSFPLSLLTRVKMRMVPFLATTLLLILSMNPEVTSQSNCYIKTNGCSVPLDLPFIYKNTFYPACVKHDVCYTCVRVAWDCWFLVPLHIGRFWSSHGSWGETKGVCTAVEAGTKTVRLDIHRPFRT